MDKIKKALVVWAVMGVMLGTYGLVFAEGNSDPEPVAQMKINAQWIDWVPKVAYEVLTLTVGGPGDFHHSEAFASGVRPYLQVDSSFPDGQYTYELSVTPRISKEVSDMMDTVRSEGDVQLRDEMKTLVPLPNESPYQFGYFRIDDGTLVQPNDLGSSTVEDMDPSEGNLVTQDVLHNDDVIITGSQCVGFDCVNGESFGSDTIILKENNLRIYFNDTSNSASFPTNNWRITINDSINGGASYFSVDDADRGRSIFKIEPGAPSNSLYVEDYGRVGLGTATPVVELHIKDSDTPTVRLEQDSSGGWPAQTWDVAGNESNFFIRDATNGSKLPFRIQPGTPSSTLCLKSDGHVGIGTWSPEETLHVEGNAIIKGNLELGSSREYKENIRQLDTEDALAALKLLRPVRFQYKNDPDEESVGFIAEEAPELLATQNKKSVSPMDIVGVLTKVVQEQQKTIEKLIHEVEELKNSKGIEGPAI